MTAAGGVSASERFTVNAGFIRPVGFTATYTTMQSVGCLKHGTYTLFCAECYWVPVAHTVTLGGDVLALVLDREDGSLLEVIGTDTYWETAQTVATWGNLVVSEHVWNMPEVPHNVAVAMHEATLYADCFGVAL